MEERKQRKMEGMEMNAYKLADELEINAEFPLDDRHRGASMLRQQADRIAKLEKQVATWEKATMEARVSNSLYKADVKKLHDELAKQTNAEPVAWMSSVNGETVYVGYEPADGYLAIPLYTTPQTKPLSDEEIVEIYESVKQDKDLTWEEWCITWEEWCKEQIEFARAIEERILGK